MPSSGCDARSPAISCGRVGMKTVSQSNHTAHCLHYDPEAAASAERGSVRLHTSGPEHTEAPMKDLQVIDGRRSGTTSGPKGIFQGQPV